jgi:DDE family transposase
MARKRITLPYVWWRISSWNVSGLISIAPGGSSSAVSSSGVLVWLCQHWSGSERLRNFCSKYNPIERCWGILENYWNGALLDSIDPVIQFATTMTWKGKCPGVELVPTTYQTGVKLTKEAMQRVEAQLQRLPGLDKWFVDIVPTSAIIRAT